MPSLLLRPNQIHVRYLDSLAILVTVAIAFLRPPIYDESWIWFESRHLVSNGWYPWQFALAYFSPDTPSVASQWYLFTIGHFSLLTELAVVARAPFVLSAFVSWILIRRILLNDREQAGILWLPMAWGIWLLWVAGALYIRPELLEGTLSLFIVWQISTPKSPQRFQIFSASAALACSASMTFMGLVTLPLAVVSIAQALRSRAISLDMKLVNIGASLGLGGMILFPGGGLLALQSRLSQFNDTTNRTVSSSAAQIALGERERFLHLMFNGDGPQRLFLGLVIVGFLVLVLDVARRLVTSRSTDKLALTLAVGATPLLLLYGNSKWGWHYSALVAVPIVALVAMRRWRLRVSVWIWLILVVIVFLTVFYFSSSSWNPISPIGIGLYISLLALLLPFRWMNGLLISRVALASLLLLTLVTLETNRNFSDSRSGYSWLRQSIEGLFDREKQCGVGSILGVPEDSAVEVYGPAAMLSPCFRGPKYDETEFVEIPTWSIGPLFYDRNATPVTNPSLNDCVTIAAFPDLCAVRLIPKG